MSSFVHKVSRLMQYLGLAKCLAILGKGALKAFLQSQSRNFAGKSCMYERYINATGCLNTDRLSGLVDRVLGYRSGGPGSNPDTARKKSSGSGTGSTQPREYN
jgi:hypothetical protein